ncbi:FLOT1 protein, partial [Asarcornis scutulata]|nr:FLOT1 protein [Asarcornis scutulata]
QEIYKDRQKFSEQVFNVASSDLVNMGISVVSYTLKDIHDDQVAPGGGQEGTQRGHGWHWRLLGHPQDTWVPPGHLGYPWAPQSSPFLAPPKHLGPPHTRLGPSAGMFGTPQGHLDPFRPLSKFLQTKQQIEEQRAQVLVVERAQQAQLQEHEIGRRERELEATVRKPAEAERYRLERLAEAER